MLEIKSGAVLNAHDAKSGEGQKGAWFMLPVKAEKGYDKITVWASNPEAVNGASAVKIKSIDAVKKSARKKDEKWYDEYSITATLEKADAKASGGDDFMEVPSNADIDALFGL